jgi:TIGR03009 family protein
MPLVGAGLAVCSLCLLIPAQSFAQASGTGTAKKKKSAVVQTKAEEEASAPPAKRKVPVDNDPDAGEGTATSRTKQDKPNRPSPQVLRIPAITPEVEKILQDWERVTSQFKKLVGEFDVMKFDVTFETEKTGKGKFAYEAPDKGNYERRGVEIKKGEKSLKLNKDGEPYTLQSLAPERWICNGKEIIKIDEYEKTYVKLPIPPEDQGQNIMDSPLPFLFGMKAEQAKLRYNIKLLKQNEKQIKLEVTPLRRSDAENWDRAIIVIDAKRFVPEGVRLFDPTGTETIHVFRNVEVNPKNNWFKEDPFKPNLRSYKPAVTRDAQLSSTENSTGKSGDRPATAKSKPAGEDSSKKTAANADASTRKGSATK